MIDNPLNADASAPQYFLYHRSGPHLRATFQDAHTARMWELGNARDHWADMFFVTDKDGKTVTFEQNAHGHAYSILARAAKEALAFDDQGDHEGGSGNGS